MKDTKLTIIALILCMIFIFGTSSLIFYSISDSKEQAEQSIKQRTSTGLIKGAYANEKQCLTEALWHEARGTSKQEMQLVASVVINRVQSKQYPSTICDVVHQPMQFSYRNAYPAGKKLKVQASNTSEKKALAEIKQVVHTALKKQKVGYKLVKPSNLPKDALHYATKGTKNYWTKRKKKVMLATNLEHNFYR